MRNGPSSPRRSRGIRACTISVCFQPLSQRVRWFSQGTSVRQFLPGGGREGRRCGGQAARGGCRDRHLPSGSTHPMRPRGARPRYGNGWRFRRAGLASRAALPLLHGVEQGRVIQSETAGQQAVIGVRDSEPGLKAGDLPARPPQRLPPPGALITLRCILSIIDHEQAAVAKGSRH